MRYGADPDGLVEEAMIRNESWSPAPYPGEVKSGCSSLRFPLAYAIHIRGYRGLVSELNSDQSLLSSDEPRAGNLAQMLATATYSSGRTCISHAIYRDDPVVMLVIMPVRLEMVLIVNFKPG